MKDMNWLKSEVEKINRIAKVNLNCDTLKYSEGVYDGTRDILDKIEQLDEPELPEIPSYIAEWIENNKHKYDNILHFAKDYYDGDIEVNMYSWVTKNNNLFSLAWLVGYRIEERKYYARIKGSDQHFARDNPTYLKREVKDKGYELVYLREDANLMNKEQWKRKGITEDTVDFEEDK